MLRPYLNQLLDNLRVEMKTAKKILCQAPTGAGKGHLIKYICENTKVPTLVLVHRKELKKDLENRSKFIEVRMVETAKRHLDFSKYQLLICDECHLVYYDNIVKEFKGHVIGFTATPIRTGNQASLDTVYESMIKSLNTQQLIDLNYLVPTINYTYQGIDWSKVKKSQGDFDLNEQAIQFEKRQVYKGVISNYNRLTPNTKTMVFTSNIQSSIDLAEHLSKSGLKAYAIHSKMKPNERELLVNKFINSESDILVNCSILTTGFDCPDIETIILYRATTSRALYNQCVGRGVRISNNKTSCTVLDFGENIKRFGFWEDDYEYTLKKQEKQSKTAGFEPVKECPQCDRLLKAKDTICKYCNYTYPAKKEVETEVVDLVLAKNKIGYYLHRATTTQEAIKIVTKDFGYKLGWWYLNKKRYPHII